jgi:hypothetical protein
MLHFHKKQGGALHVRESRLTIAENVVIPCRFFSTGSSLRCDESCPCFVISTVFWNRL